MDSSFAGRFAAVFTIIACWIGLSSPAEGAAATPNVIVILADDLGWGDLACQGAEDMRTPHLDQLFAESLVFDSFYANCCVCSPTRAALLTGCYPDRVGVPGVIRTHPENSWGYLRPDQSTVADRFAEAGYETIAVGKWHLGLTEENHPLRCGFTTFKGFLGDMMDDYYDHRRHGNNYMRDGWQEIDPAGHATDLFSEWAATELRRASQSEQPFFLYLAYNAPHTPIQPPAEWQERVEQREPGVERDRAKLIALIEHLDQGIGKVLASLDETGLTGETIVLFTSDNGGQLSVGANNGPYRGAKGEMYEGGLRVPMCVRWPGRIDPGRTAGVGSTVDLMPTLCDLCAVDAGSTTLDGMSFRPLLEKHDAEWPDREVYFVRREGGAEFNGLTIQALRRGDWKLLQNRPGEPFELYNLARDPYEERDRRNEAPAQYRALSAALRLHIQAGGEVPWQRPD